MLLHACQAGDITLTSCSACSRPSSREQTGAQVVIVRSQEIDHAGERGFTFQARQVMDTVIDNLARADPPSFRGRRRTQCPDGRPGIFSSHRIGTTRCGSTVRGDQSSFIAAAGSGEAEHPGWLCPSDCFGLATTDLDFVFPLSRASPGPVGTRFHHGGPSLQELVIPVVTAQRAGQSDRLPGQ